MKRIILALILLTAVEAFSQLCTPASGIGCDVPTAVLCTPSGTDGTLATCTWNTTVASDSLVQIVDNLSNPGATYYNPTMVTCSAGVCAHTININHLPVQTTPTSAEISFPYIVTSCTHATFGNIGTQCPDTSPDVSSTGPPTRAPGPLPKLTTLRRQLNVLSSWYVVPQAPKHAFQGQEFFINVRAGSGIGKFGTVDNTYVNYLLLYNVSITTPSGTNICGQPAANGRTYQAYGDAVSNFDTACTTNRVSPAPLPVDQDFILVPSTASNYQTPSVGNPNGLSHGNIVTNPSNMFSGQQDGYYYSNWAGNDAALYVRVGANVPAGNYVIHYHLQPLFSDGTGGPDAGTLLSQDKQIDVPITVVTAVPLARNPPSSFPAWSFQPQFMAMAGYWTTWGCSNISDNRSGNGPMAMIYNSGASLTNIFSPGTSVVQPYQYDGARFYLSMGDRIFNSTYPTWLPSHTYTIGDIITVTVSGKPTTFIMNLVGGLASPGLTGTSGTSEPTFNATPGQVTTDGSSPLQWQSIGSKTYYDGCALVAHDGYRNNILMSNASIFPEYAMYPTGMLMSYFRTGDAAPGNELGHTFPNGVAGAKLSGLNAVSPAYGMPATCSVYPTGGDLGGTGTGTSSYWTGGEKLALCLGQSLTCTLCTAINANNPSTGRQKGETLAESDAYWSSTQDPTFINGPDGARMQREVNTNMALLDLIETLPSSSLFLPAGNQGAMVQTFYMNSLLAESLLHYYQMTVYYSDTTKFPCTMPAGYPSGFGGPCVTPDERIPQALKTLADWLWVSMYDLEYDKNQVVADACNPSPPCQHTPRRLHSHAFRYSPYEPVDFLIANSFTTESAGNAEYGWLFAWLWARDSTMIPPSNGRITVSNYRDIALEIWQHIYDGRNCPNVSGTTPGNCSSWGIADYVNGGRSTGSGYNQLVNSSKTIQQSAVNFLGEGLPWGTGVFTSDQGNMSLSQNPCWIAANRNADGTCNAPSPYADVQHPYTINLYFSGGRPGVIIPTICRPGTVGNFNNTVLCVSQNPTSTLGNNKGFGSNNVPLNNGSYIGGTISNTLAIFNFMTTENATCSIVVGPTSGGTVEPTHITSGLSQNTFLESPAHTPTLAGGTPMPLWYHTITVNNLTPTTPYHFGVYCTDDGSNPPDPLTCTANAAHCFNLPYEVGGATGKFTVQYSQTDQAQTFTTTALPTGSDLVIQPGVFIGRGILIK